MLDLLGPGLLAIVIVRVVDLVLPVLLLVAAAALREALRVPRGGERESAEGGTQPEYLDRPPFF